MGMTPFFRILLGLAIMIVGFLFVLKTRTLMDWFGRVEWAERKLGAGGSWTFYKLLGVGIAFLGVFIATNIISDILTSFASLFVP